MFDCISTAGNANPCATTKLHTRQSNEILRLISHDIRVSFSASAARSNRFDIMKRVALV